MNDLKVECYDAKEVAAKKRSIKKRLAIAGGVIAISAGLFCSCRIFIQGGAGAWYNCAAEPCDCELCTCDECTHDGKETADNLDS